MSCSGGKRLEPFGIAKRSHRHAKGFIFCRLFLRVAEPYLFRIVVPRRDYQRVEWLAEVLKSEGFELVLAKVEKLFEERSDLDVIEVVFIAKLAAQPRKELEKRLAASLRGSIGFFVSHPYKR